MPHLFLSFFRSILVSIFPNFHGYYCCSHSRTKYRLFNHPCPSVMAASYRMQPIHRYNRHLFVWLLQIELRPNKVSMSTPTLFLKCLEFQSFSELIKARFVLLLCHNLFYLNEFSCALAKHTGVASEEIEDP